MTQGLQGLVSTRKLQAQQSQYRCTNQLPRGSILISHSLSQQKKLKWEEKALIPKQIFKQGTSECAYSYKIAIK